jgi:DUF2971 family protein
MRVYRFLEAQYALKTLYEHRMKISTFTDLNDPFELCPFRIDSEEDREGFAALQQEFAPDYGVVCFSRDWHNPVLWSHYGEKHKGICLGFDVSDEHVMSVNYIQERSPRSQWLEDVFSLAQQ